jgi:riboflavin kinase/FMN adenylyltransferase
VPSVRLIDLKTGLPVDFPISSNFVLALGNFDGVHLAHRALLTATVKKAASLDACLSAVFCFDPPSSDYLARSGGEHLSTLQEKLDIFATCGIEYAFLADFPSLRDMTAEQFIQQILRKMCRAKAVVCGFNFRFGQGGKVMRPCLQKHLERITPRSLPLIQFNCPTKRKLPSLAPPKFEQHYVKERLRRPG